MKVSYFPGCTLKNKAKQLDIYARRCAETLGVELVEPETWQCCGGVFTSAGDEVATKLSSVRALASAAGQQMPLVTVCSGCHNVIKRTNEAMKKDAAFARKVNLYMAQENVPAYDGSCKVLHYLELLRDVVGFDALKQKVTAPLTGKKIAAYYGCLLLRPAADMAMDDPENPRIFEDFIRALGADAVEWSSRNECCGGYVITTDPSAAGRRSRSICDDAADKGAEMIVTACPLCKYNLEKTSSVPVVYLTEILAQALGVKEGTDGE